MKLNLDIIQTYLYSHHTTKRYGLSERLLNCPRPLLYTKGLPFEEGALYIAQSESLPKTPPDFSCAVIAIGTHLPQEWILGNTQLLVVNHTDQIFTVFNEVSTLYNHFDQWDAHIRDELEKELDFNLCEILKAGAKLLKKNISVVDHTLQNIFYLVYSQNSDGSSDIHVQEDSQPFSVEYSEKVKEVCNLERMITQPYLTAISLNKNCYCNNQFLEGQFTGCISVNEGDTLFSEGDYPLMDYFFSIFRKAYVKYIRTHGKTDSLNISGLKKLLDHIPLNDSEKECFSLNPGEYWVCFKLKEQRTQKYLPNEYMCANINAIFPQKAYATLQNRELIGLLKIQVQEEQPEGILPSFEEFVQRMGYWGGISNPFINLNRFHDFLLQASYAAERKNTDSQPLRYFYTCALQYLLFTCSREMDTHSLLPGGLLSLQQHDYQKHTEYVQTLSTYLQKERSLTKTADALFIHRSSLLKRLDKIQRIIKDDLNDAEIRLYYQICLALLQSTEQI